MSERDSVRGDFVFGTVAQRSWVVGNINIIFGRCTRELPLTDLSVNADFPLSTRSSWRVRSRSAGHYSVEEDRSGIHI